MKITFKLLITLLISGLSYAQNATITGVVIGADTRQPLPGATVYVDGTTSGTTTDFDGNYAIVAPQGAVIVFTYVGYQAQNITVGQNSTVNVELLTENELDEIVVVGYGSQKRSNLVGSVSSVDVKKASQIPTTNVSELLRGRAAGVQVNLGDARPGGSSRKMLRNWYR